MPPIQGQNTPLESSDPMPYAVSQNVSLKRTGQVLRWLGVLLFIIFLLAYLYTVSSQAIFYEFNVWNWFFSSDIAYKLLGFGVGALLICAGHVLRTTSAPTLKDTGWKEVNGVRKIIILLTLGLLGIIVFGNTFLLPRATTVVYPLACTPASETDRTCVSYTPTYQHAFNVEQGRQYVISWTYHAIPTMYVVHHDCNVQDQHNWECKSTTGQEIFGEKNAEFYEYGTNQSSYQEIYKMTAYATKEQWEGLNGGPEPTIRRTTQLLCLLTGESCYGL